MCVCVCIYIKEPLYTLRNYLSCSNAPILEISIKEIELIQIRAYEYACAHTHTHTHNRSYVETDITSRNFQYLFRDTTCSSTVISHAVSDAISIVIKALTCCQGKCIHYVSRLSLNGHLQTSEACDSSIHVTLDGIKRAVPTQERSCANWYVAEFFQKNSLNSLFFSRVPKDKRYLNVQLCTIDITENFADIIAD